MNKTALLALSDGTLLYGQSIGASGVTSGEIIFNTAMTGYQEILTDPSYAEQIVMLTCPHIGNVGWNASDNESHKIWAEGLVVRSLSENTQHWRSERSLQTQLRQEGRVGISDVDVRQLTHMLREQGAQGACIATTDHTSPEEALALARAVPSLSGRDLARVVTTIAPYEWQEGSGHWRLEAEVRAPRRVHIVAYDFGVKRHILQILVDLGCRVTVVPAMFSAEEALSLQPDGIFLSNGPGDPAACTYAIHNIQCFLARKIPLFGICLGFQLLALAVGARTFKMKFGHHGANHPVVTLEQANKVMITSQNHGFAVDETSLSSDWVVTHRSLFDESLQGIRHQTDPAFGFQGHPEASPGPHDGYDMFKQFINLMVKSNG